MKLFIMRHGEAKPSQNGDFKRELSEKGAAQAAAVADFIQAYPVNKILASYVKRTMQTANIIMEKLPPTSLEMVTEFYEGEIDDVMKLIANQNDKDKNLLLIGHNPLIVDVVMAFVSRDDPKHEVIATAQFSPATIVTIDLPQLHDWQDIRKHQHQGRVLDMFSPQ